MANRMTINYECLISLSCRKGMQDHLLTLTMQETAYRISKQLLRTRISDYSHPSVLNVQRLQLI